MAAVPVAIGVAMMKKVTTCSLDIQVQEAIGKAIMPIKDDMGKEWCP